MRYDHPKILRCEPHGPRLKRAKNTSPTSLGKRFCTAPPPIVRNNRLVYIFSWKDCELAGFWRLKLDQKSVFFLGLTHGSARSMARWQNPEELCFFPNLADLGGNSPRLRGEQHDQTYRPGARVWPAANNIVHSSWGDASGDSASQCSVWGNPQLVPSPRVTSRFDQSP